MVNFQLILAMEWGYKAHERGLNINEAKNKFMRVITPRDNFINMPPSEDECSVTKDMEGSGFEDDF